jgi:hypothetical protein
MDRETRREGDAEKSERTLEEDLPPRRVSPSRVMIEIGRPRIFQTLPITGIFFDKFFVKIRGTYVF